MLSRFAKTNRVLHASPPYYIRDVFSGIGQRGRPRDGATAITNNLTVYTPPRWLPKSYASPTIERIFTGMRQRHIRAAMHRAGMSKPILYIWHPAQADQIGAYDESLVVYHCYDEYFAFRMDASARDELMQKEKRLLDRADVVFAASEELRERRRKVNPNTHLIRNGVDYDLFARAQHADTRVPEDIASIRSPVIGCVGTQLLMFDLPLLTEIFARRRDWSFVFIGIDRTAEQHADSELRALQSLPNVHFIGRRPLQSIPEYLKGCDVCTVPWVLNDISLVSSSPLKLYEYFASGKPIVSKPLPLISHLAPPINFAMDSDEWIDAIEAALRQNSAEDVAQRQEIARANTWDKRVEVILTKLAEKL